MGRIRLTWTPELSRKHKTNYDLICSLAPGGGTDVARWKSSYGANNIKLYSKSFAECLEQVHKNAKWNEREGPNVQEHFDKLRDFLKEHFSLKTVSKKRKRKTQATDPPVALKGTPAPTRNKPKKAKTPQQLKLQKTKQANAKMKLMAKA